MNKIVFSGLIIFGTLLLMLPLVGCTGSSKGEAEADQPSIEEIPSVSPELKKLYQEAEGHYQAGNFKGALKILKKNLKRVENPTQRENFLFLIAESLFQLKSYETAHKKYQQFLSTYPKTKRLNEVIQREFEIGFAFIKDTKRTFFRLPILPASDYGMEIVRKTLEKYPYTPSAEKYHLILADYLYQKKRYEEARLEYESFIKTYPQSPFFSEAQFMIAQCYFKEYQGPEYDAAPLINAKKTLTKLLENHPEGEKIEEARQVLSQIIVKEAERDYRVGYFYWRSGKIQAAQIYLEGVIKNYPETEWAKKAHKILETKMVQ